MPSLAESALMLDALSGDMDRDFPHAAQAYRDDALRNPEKWNWGLAMALNRRTDAGGAK